MGKKKQDFDEQEFRKQVMAKAKRRTYKKIGFLWHLVVFVMVTAAIVAINYRYTPSYLWFIWVLGGWGLGLALHAFATFSSGRMTEEMIDREIEREKRRRGITT